MFLSKPSFEFAMPRGLLGPGAMAWRAIELSAWMPWFVATIRHRDGAESHIQTLCIWWDKDLVELIQAGADVVGLQLMLPGRGAAKAQWVVQSISSVWRATDADGLEILIFRDTQGIEFHGVFGHLLEGLVNNRQAVLILEPACDVS